MKVYGLIEVAVPTMHTTQQNFVIAQFQTNLIGKDIFINI